MTSRAIGLSFIAALLLSAAFALSTVYTFAWVSHPPASIATDVIRAFFMPQALSAAVTLDALAPEQDASSMTFLLAFIATLPASFVYVVVCAACVRLLQRLRSPERQRDRLNL